MSPTPSVEHKREEKRLLLAFYELIEAQELGEVFHQVNVADPVKGMDDYRVPDLCVVLSESQAKIEHTYIAGGPDLKTVKTEQGLKIAICHRDNPQRVFWV